MLPQDLELTALLHEAHNFVCEELKTAQPTLSACTAQRPMARHSMIPPPVLAALSSLAPKATKAACTLLDSGAAVEAVTSETAVAFVVGGHVALVGGFHFSSSSPSLSPVPGRVHHSCDCGAYAFRGERFCKHIVAAGLCAAMGTSRIRRVSPEEFSKLLSGSTTTRRAAQTTEQE